MLGPKQLATRGFIHSVGEMLRRLPVYLQDAELVNFHGGKHNGELRQALRGWFKKASALQPASPPKLTPPPKPDLSILIPRCEIAPLALAQYLLSDVPFAILLPVDLLACNLDQGQPNFPKHILPEYLSKIGVPHRIEYQDTYSIVTDKLPAGATYCSLCSRLRRGHLYRIAREEGCSALVLGHHREDSLETFFLNLFHGGRLAAMPPKLRNDDGDLMVLRPLIYCAEPDLARFAEAMAFPIIPCDLCGSQDGLQRNAMKAMLNDIEQRQPGRKDIMIRALGNANPSHLLDPKLFDFAGLAAVPTRDAD